MRYRAAGAALCLLLGCESERRFLRPDRYLHGKTAQYLDRTLEPVQAGADDPLAPSRLMDRLDAPARRWLLGKRVQRSFMNDLVPRPGRREPDASELEYQSEALQKPLTRALAAYAIRAGAAGALDMLDDPRVNRLYGQRQLARQPFALAEVLLPGFSLDSAPLLRRIELSGYEDARGGAFTFPVRNGKLKVGVVGGGDMGTVPMVELELQF